LPFWACFSWEESYFLKGRGSFSLGQEALSHCRTFKAVNFIEPALHDRDVHREAGTHPGMYTPYIPGRGIYTGWYLSTIPREAYMRLIPTSPIPREAVCASWS